jgi:cytochrome c-type biogenesis protein
LDTGAAKEQVERFVEDYGVTYTILHDPENRAMELYRVLGLPATFLIDRDGVLRWMRYGPVGETDQEFLSKLEDALG